MNDKMSTSKAKRQMQTRELASLSWLTWIIAFSVTTAGTVLLLPFLRQWPEMLHTFAKTLHPNQRQLMLFAFCVIVAKFGLSLLSPKASQLRHFLVVPPMWSAVLLGLATVGMYDITFHLSPNGYKPTWWDWTFYGGLPLVLVCAVTFASESLVAVGDAGTDENPLLPSPGEENTAANKSKLSTWPILEKWLESDSPADSDFFGHETVSDQLKSHLLAGRRSIGLVGRFGAGKSSVVEWMKIGTEPNLIVRTYRCWGYDSSEAAINDILSDALSAVGAEIDTFSVNSLPAAYRRSIGAAGGVVDSLSHLLAWQDDPADQFERLSSLLGYLSRRLVIVVEDLDRNDSRSFDVQEVTAFLQRLKDYKHLSFVLTGGNTSNIDFAKLCDHVLYVSDLSVDEVAGIVCMFRDGCLDVSRFHQILIDDDDNVWEPFRYGLSRNFDDMWPPDAISRLLTTPRSLRHALSKTLTAWKTLCGEVCWDHLFILNVLHFSAPEAFDFLCRRWPLLREQPTPLFAGNPRAAVVEKLKSEWSQITAKVDWNIRSAVILIESLLPTANLWFDGTHRADVKVQGVDKARYWNRAINEIIGPKEVRDQKVMSDIKKWMSSPDADVAMLSSVLTSGEYSDVWVGLVNRFMGGDEERVRQGISSLLNCMRSAKRNNASFTAEGGHAASAIARNLSRSDENAEWVKQGVNESFGISLLLAYELHHRFVENLGTRIVPEGRVEELREHFRESCRHAITDASSLDRILPDEHVVGLYRMMERTGPGGVERFVWMGPIILAALEAGSIRTALNVLGISDEIRSNRGNIKAGFSLLFGGQVDRVMSALERTCATEDLPHKDWVVNYLGITKRSLQNAEASASDELEPRPDERGGPFPRQEEPHVPEGD